MDFNHITLHFIECIHVHLDNTRPKVCYLESMLPPIICAYYAYFIFFLDDLQGAGLPQAQTSSMVQTPIRSDVKEYHSSLPNQVSLACTFYVYV